MKTFLALLVFAGFAALPTTAAARSPVKITGDDIASYAFDPATIHVGKGGKVRWKWDSNAPHNVTFKNGEASDTGAAESYSLKFKQAGTFKYRCTIHGFKGKVIVG